MSQPQIQDLVKVPSKGGASLDELKDVGKLMRIKSKGLNKSEICAEIENILKTAEQEGNKEAASLFKQIAKVEKEHEARYKRLLEMVEKGTVYKRDKPIRWKCSKCGYIFEGKEPPEKCPSCKHEREYYEPECMCFSKGDEACGL